jgi:hypothetical protein
VHPSNLDCPLPFFNLRTAIRLGIIGQLPGKTPEATMASALYTDIKKWKDGKGGSLFCR